MVLDVMVAVNGVMMAVIKILLPVATALADQTVPFAGTAIRVLRQNTVVMASFTAVMALMNLTHILNVIIAQRKVVCPVQAFLATVESFVMASQRVQISGTSYFPPVDLSNSTRMTLKFAVRMIAYTSVKMDLCA